MFKLPGLFSGSFYFSNGFNNSKSRFSPFVALNFNTFAKRKKQHFKNGLSVVCPIHYLKGREKSGDKIKGKRLGSVSPNDRGDQTME